MAFSWRWTLAAILAWGQSCTASPARTETEPQPRFVFQNSFWVNLHHFLRAEARRQARGAELDLPLEQLHADEAQAWSEGLAAYRDLSRRNLLFDDELVAINCALAGAGNPDTLASGLVARDLTAALNGAAPIYRARLWHAQGRLNAEWIAATEPEIARHAAELTAALASAYRVEWPALPILVDPCSESGPYLAYTTNTAPRGFAGHITISPRAPNVGAVAFECVVHEASHVVDHVLTGWIDEESARQGIEPPPELWHALLFFTSGVVAERTFGAPGTYRRDVAEGYPAYSDALEQYWRPYLESGALFEPALRALVREAGEENAARAAR